jgi:L-histidine N-alpha-methyltransferase
VNATFDADFQPDRFRHVAFWDPARAWIDMRLRAETSQRVHVGALDLDLRIPAGGEIRTEISCKFTRASIAEAGAGVGLALRAWYTDPDDLFGMALFAREGG